MIIDGTPKGWHANGGLRLTLRSFQPGRMFDQLQPGSPRQNDTKAEDYQRIEEDIAGPVSSIQESARVAPLHVQPLYFGMTLTHWHLLIRPRGIQPKILASQLFQVVWILKTRPLQAQFPLYRDQLFVFIMKVRQTISILDLLNIEPDEKDRAKNEHDPQDAGEEYPRLHPGPGGRLPGILKIVSATSTSASAPVLPPQPGCRADPLTACSHPLPIFQWPADEHSVSSDSSRLRSYPGEAAFELSA